MIYVDKEGALRKTHSIHKLNTFNSERWFLLSHVRAFGEQISTSKITRTLYTYNLRIAYSFFTFNNEMQLYKYHFLTFVHSYVEEHIAWITDNLNLL